jgi:HD-GYP domain-containing protein (c-di-GMP phosphodiesterase class II)
MSHQEALQELRNCGGSQFDPQLVETFCDQVYPDLYAAGDGLQANAHVAGASDVSRSVS